MTRRYEFYVRAKQYCFYHENINIQIFEPRYTDKNYRGEENYSALAGIYCISLPSLVYFLQILLEYRNDRHHSLSSFKSMKFLFFFFYFGIVGIFVLFSERFYVGYSEFKAWSKRRTY